MRPAWRMVLVLVACDSGASRPARAPTPQTVTTPADAAVDTVADTAAAVNDAPPEPIVPESLTSAPAWVARSLSLSNKAPHESLATYTFRRAGAEAVLVVDARTRRNRAPLSEDTAWPAGDVETYVGSIVETGARFTFTPSSGPAWLTLVCKRTKVAAAAATAVRQSTSRSDDCESDEGRWHPAKTTRVDALVCGTHGESGDDITFAPAPGIEHLHISDDCGLSGGGHRLIGADGAIAPARKR